MNDIERDLHYYRKIKQEIINHERSFDKDTLPRVKRVIQALEKQEYFRNCIDCNCLEGNCNSDKCMKFDIEVNPKFDGCTFYEDR